MRARFGQRTPDNQDCRWPNLDPLIKRGDDFSFGGEEPKTVACKPASEEASGTALGETTVH
jgi:hypothetical protein